MYRKLTPKRKKIILASSALLAIVLILGLTLLIFKKNKADLTDEQLFKNEVSYPVSYTNLEDELDVFKEIASGYKFVNENLFERRSYTNLFPHECYTVSSPSIPDAPTNVVVSAYNESEYQVSENLETAASFVFEDMSQYINNHEYIKLTYEKLSRLLAGEGLASNTMDYLNGFVLGCTGNPRLPIGKVMEFAYPRTEQSYLVIAFGSNQAVANSSWMPLSFQFVSRIGGDYSVASVFGEYKNFTKSNNLEECEVLSEYNNLYIDIFSEEGKNCVINALEDDLDQSKVDALIQEFTTVFALQ